ncbi:hypothetical protein L2E82_41160 [Cichorium intybus]|uniref:Uncharacterized protein n=1 Tax=Cichorium intybus TaxID=13427 RepID=A0ACB9ANA6_CICIN|nr:hypothetical protein L2E82_41160 [Cichorium intybus]
MTKSEQAKTSKGEDGLDLISNLSDHVLQSFLSRIQGTEEPSGYLEINGFKEFVYWVLLNKSLDLDSFRLRCASSYKMSTIRRWIHGVVMRKVKLLDLMFCPRDESEDIELPHCLVTCGSLEVLRLCLMGCHLSLPKSTGFPVLRALMYFLVFVKLLMIGRFMKKSKQPKESVREDGANMISNLPDHILHLIISQESEDIEVPHCLATCGSLEVLSLYCVEQLGFMIEDPISLPNLKTLELKVDAIHVLIPFLTCLPDLDSLHLIFPKNVYGLDKPAQRILSMEIGSLDNGPNLRPKKMSASAQNSEARNNSGRLLPAEQGARRRCRLGLGGKQKKSFTIAHLSLEYMTKSKQAKTSEGEDGVDLISNLPDHVLLSILSRLQGTEKGFRVNCIAACFDPRVDAHVSLPNLKTLELTVDGCNMNVLIPFLICLPDLESVHLIFPKHIYLVHKYMMKSKQAKTSEGEDGVFLISNSPDHVLLSILSRIQGYLEITGFKEFVYWVLLNKSLDLDSFRLRCASSYKMSTIRRWIHGAVMRKVKLLDLMFRPWDESEDIELPHCLVTCSSLEVLRLSLMGSIENQLGSQNSDNRGRLLAEQGAMTGRCCIYLIRFMTKSEQANTSESEDGVDLISNLPDHVLQSILSRLQGTEEVTRTSILSRRWRYLWTSVPSIDIDHTRRRKPFGLLEINGFKEFVYWVLLNKPLDLDSFRLSCANCYHMPTIRRWIHAAVMRKVKLLDLMFCPRDESEDIELPHCLVTCGSLEVLKLRLLECPLSLPKSTGFPVLRVLELTDVELFKDNLVKYFLESCPFLEDLSLINCKADELIISCPKLKSLRIDTQIEGDYDSDDDAGFGWRMCHSLEICCPKLEFLKLTGYVAMEFLFESLYSLKKAVLHAIDLFLFEAPPFDFFDRISHVESLSISSNSIGEWLAPRVDAPISLPNLKTLEVLVDDHDMNALIPFLICLPDLESLHLIFPKHYYLVDHWKLDEAATMSIVTRHLKKVEFCEFDEEKSTPGVARALLEHGNELEEMFFSWSFGDRVVERAMETMDQVLKFHKASPTVKVKFFLCPGEDLLDIELIPGDL